MVIDLKFQIVVVLIVVVLNTVNVISQNSEIIYNLANIGSVNAEISEDCRNDLRQIFNSINHREIWAMKLLDASGKFGSGFVWGNNYVLGDEYGCRIVNNPTYITQTRHLNPLNPPNFVAARSPFPVEYRMIYIRHNSQFQFDFRVYDRKILHIGLCFPKSCRDADTMELTRNYFTQHEFVGHELIGTSITVLRTKTLELRSNFWNDHFVKLLTCITAFNVLNIIIGTIYTYNLQQNRIKSSKKTDDHKPLIPSVLNRWFISFSLIENTKIIFNLKTGDDTIKIIHGIRAVGMLWLVLGHVLLFTATSIDNLEIVMELGDIWYFQPIVTDFLGVDTFIALGAFLLSFLFFERIKTAKKENGIVMAAKAILFRYFRLTPLYFVTILLTYASTIYLEDTTPFSMIENFEKNCNERWWLNLIYLNNLFPMKDICLNWSWYLSNDFQTFVIAIVVLVIFTRNKKLGICLGACICLASMGLNMYFAAKLKFSFALDSYFNNVDLLYFGTWNRIAAYFVGIIAGCYFSKHNRQLRLSKFYIILNWIMAEIIIFGTIFLHVYKEFNPILGVLYAGFGRILWCMATCWIIIACASNNAGYMTRVLGSKIWIPISRLTFACYLVNPITIVMVFMPLGRAYHFNLLLYMIESIGFIIISYVAAYFMMVIFEIPFNKLIKTFIENKIR